MLRPLYAATSGALRGDGAALEFVFPSPDPGFFLSYQAHDRTPHRGVGEPLLALHGVILAIRLSWVLWIAAVWLHLPPARPAARRN